MIELHLDNPPKTVKEAVEMLIVIWPPEELKKLASLSEADLSLCHFGIGLWIRNNFGLWAKNKALLEDAGEEHPDQASGVIIEMLWEKLQEK